MAIPLKDGENPIAVIPAPPNLVFNLPYLGDEAIQPVAGIVVLHDVKTHSIRWIALGEHHQTPRLEGVNEFEYAEFIRHENKDGRAVLVETLGKPDSAENSAKTGSIE